MATDKLSLPSAGRRIFRADGSEAFTANDLSRDVDVYISCGENFKDPFLKVKSMSF